MKWQSDIFPPLVYVQNFSDHTVPCHPARAMMWVAGAWGCQQWLIVATSPGRRGIFPCRAGPAGAWKGCLRVWAHCTCAMGIVLPCMPDLPCYPRGPEVTATTTNIYLLQIKDLCSCMHARLKQGGNGVEWIRNSDQFHRFLFLGSRRNWDLAWLATESEESRKRL